jgi:nitronate monooxygenase
MCSELTCRLFRRPWRGFVSSEMVVAVSEAGGLGSLPCALLNADQLRAELGAIRQRISCPINVNFFCHHPPEVDLKRELVSRECSASYYIELGLDPKAPVPNSSRTAFDGTMCDLVVEFKPEVVSFHFGLPDRDLVSRVKATGAKIILRNNRKRGEMARERGLQRDHRIGLGSRRTSWDVS